MSGPFGGPDATERLPTEGANREHRRDLAAMNNSDGVGTGKPQVHDGRAVGPGMIAGAIALSLEHSRVAQAVIGVIQYFTGHGTQTEPLDNSARNQDGEPHLARPGTQRLDGDALPTILSEADTPARAAAADVRSPELAGILTSSAQGLLDVYIAITPFLNGENLPQLGELQELDTKLMQVLWQQELSEQLLPQGVEAARLVIEMVPVLEGLRGQLEDVKRALGEQQGDIYKIEDSSPELLPVRQAALQDSNDCWRRINNYQQRIDRILNDFPERDIKNVEQLLQPSIAPHEAIQFFLQVDHFFQGIKNAQTALREGAPLLIDDIRGMQQQADRLVEPAARNRPETIGMSDEDLHIQRARDGLERYRQDLLTREVPPVSEETSRNIEGLLTRASNFMDAAQAQLWFAITARGSVESLSAVPETRERIQTLLDAARTNVEAAQAIVDQAQGIESNAATIAHYALNGARDNLARTRDLLVAEHENIYIQGLPLVEQIAARLNVTARDVQGTYTSSISPAVSDGVVNAAETLALVERVRQAINQGGADWWSNPITSETFHRARTTAENVNEALNRILYQLRIVRHDVVMDGGGIAGIRPDYERGGDEVTRVMNARDVALPTLGQWEARIEQTRTAVLRAREELAPAISRLQSVGSVNEVSQDLSMLARALQVSEDAFANVVAALRGGVISVEQQAGSIRAMTGAEGSEHTRTHFEMTRVENVAGNVRSALQEIGDFMRNMNKNNYSVAQAVRDAQSVLKGASDYLASARLHANSTAEITITYNELIVHDTYHAQMKISDALRYLASLMPGETPAGVMERIETIQRQLAELTGVDMGKRDQNS